LLAFYLTVFGGFLCLIPLALYCLILAGINRRRHPTLISGAADVGLTLLALSGFLIVGGPVVLSGMQGLWRRWAYSGSFESMGQLIGEPAWPWIVVHGLYFVLVVGGAAMALRRAGSRSVALNADYAGIRAALDQSCDRLGIPVAEQGSRLNLGGAMLELRSAPVLRSVTLDWMSDASRVRRVVEEELRKVLLMTDAPRSPVASWLMAAATVLFIVQMAAFGLLFLFLYYARN
jgi:hypothetical protein